MTRPCTPQEKNMYTDLVSSLYTGRDKVHIYQSDSYSESEYGQQLYQYKDWNITDILRYFKKGISRNKTISQQNLESVLA